MNEVGESREQLSVRMYKEVDSRSPLLYVLLNVREQIGFTVEVQIEKRTVYKNSVKKRLQNLLNDGRNASVHTDSLDIDLPSFYDPERFRLGQQAFYNNVFTMMIAKLSGLLTLFAVPTIVDVIVFTKQSNIPCTAFQRYVSTIFHTFVWYEKEPEKQKEFLQSLKIVRRKHCVAFHRSFNAGIRKASQTDMALAQFGFIGFILLGTEQLGIYTTDEEMDGLVHFWRVIGCALGMEDKYNLCMETVEETRALCSKILDEVFLPSLVNSKKIFNDMGHVLLKGLWPVNPYLDPHAFTAFTLHLASSVATNNNHSINIDYQSMPQYSKFIFNLQLFVHRYLIATNYWWSVIFRKFFNSQMRLAIYLTEHFPFLAYWSFGVKQSHVNIYRYNVK
ncbi:hypothetical protein HZH68_016856 [Vespula germanica]|uniref:ER-bound oxygenase mpaB/mpaB'/Rubber oxygenase catalytic domain-containing protein n=1 Tax=Vespula germanica TaxID=30212 RepID=A0A834MR55_VESGE|nr:hypothetical protein HZH68_016856 [Vespula germanica]